MRKLWSALFLILNLSACYKSEKLKIPAGFTKIWAHQELDWNTSSLIRDKEFIYGLTLDEKLFKVELRTGKLIWKRPALPNYQGQKPLIIGNNIFIGGRDSIFAYDVDGNLLWKQRTGQKIGHTLIPYKTQLIGSVRSKGLFAFEQRLGTTVWSIIPGYQMLSSSDPIVVDSLLVVGDFDYKDNEGSSLHCINVETRQTKWSCLTPTFLTSEAETDGITIYLNFDSAFAKGFTSAFDLQSGNMLWERKTFPDSYFKPNLLAGKLFIGSYEYGLLCLDPKNGKLLWRLDMNRDYPDARILLHNNQITFASCIKGVLYTLNLDGKVIDKTDFGFGIGDPFFYLDTLYINTGAGEMYRK